MAISTISLGKVKFNWRGDWASNQSYAKDDVVKYGPNVYTCLTAHTSQATFALNDSDWDLMVSGLENAGVWNTTTLYKVGQTVTYGGAVYIALQESINLNPYTNSAYWQRFVDGQQFEGDWVSTTDYQKGDIVRYGGYLYVAKQNTSLNNPTNNTYWDVYSKGYEETAGGIYFPDTQFRPGDTFKYGGHRYVVKEGQRPLGISPTNTTYFIKVVDGLAWRGTWDSAENYNPGELVKYGAKVYRVNAEIDSNSNSPDQNQGYDLFVDGLRFIGTYSNSQSYLKGDIVKYGGSTYICNESYENDGSTGTEPVNVQFWTLFTSGMEWQGPWSNSTSYKINDVVEYAQSSYISVIDDNFNIIPGTDSQSWQLLAQGDSNAVLTTQGDIIFRDATQATRLPIGPAGSTLVSNGSEPTWGHLTPQNDYYVSPQGDDTNDGRTPVTSWKTIRHAVDQTFSLGQVRINVSAGVYEEQTPMRVGRSVVLEGNGLGAVTVSPNNDRDEGFGVGISDDGSTPNANSYVFHMNNGSRMRNFVFRGFSTGSVVVSLDPGTGPDDTSVWITSQSPYVQNCTSFTPGGTGFKIDGGLHNGGYKSMVANDWTQINSDGIGVHALNDGRTEIVSVFTYYCNTGYLAESGAKIRAIVGNNSYGEYGAIARGFSQLETPLVGQLQLDDATINSIQSLSSNIHVFTSYRDSIGNRFFVGHTDPTGTDVTSTFDNTASYPIITKFNSAGSLDWIYTYESAFGAIHSAIELSDVIYCGGVVYDGSNKGFILAISKAGEIQWQRTVGDTSEITDLATDGNNLYAIGNHVTSGISVSMFNPAGIEQFSKTIEYSTGTGNSLIPKSCAFAGIPTSSVDTYALAGDATAENNLYIAAYDTTQNTAIVIRTDSAGNLITSYTYGDIDVNKLRIDTGNGDGIYLVLVGSYNDGVSAKPFVTRLAVDGTVQWQIYTDAELPGEYTDVLPLGDDIYVCGYLDDTNNKGIIVRYTSAGVLDWIRTIENSTNNIAFNGILLDGVNVVTAGIENANSVIVSIQRDLVNGIGTVTTGSYVLDSIAAAQIDNTVITKTVYTPTINNLTLGTTDENLTLNQSPTQARTINATRSGFSGIGTGVLFTVDNISRRPKEGSILQIDGDDETYFVLGINSYDELSGTAQIQIDPAIPSNKTPNDDTSVVFREAFSQVRMSGHDFLDIGTGGFADTNYPVIIAEDYTQQPNQDRETLAENGGRVFYVTTDQDGNFRVGDYFKVEQATGRATLSSEEFDLAGLNELQLGSITAGRQGATVNEFSTDGTFADNSDTSVPTEKAVKTYVDLQINNLSASQSFITAGDDPTQSKVEVSGTGQSTDTINFEVAGTEVGSFSNTSLLVKPGGTTSFEAAEQYMLVPLGTTAERPGTPSAGYLRFNSDTNTFEGYDGTQWSGIGGGNPWETITSTDTISNNDRIFVDTTSGAFTINLPASPLVGDQVKFADVARNFATENFTVGRNGNNIMGLAEDMIIDENGAAFTLVYSGATHGWILGEN